MVADVIDALGVPWTPEIAAHLYLAHRHRHRRLPLRPDHRAHVRALPAHRRDRRRSRGALAPDLRQLRHRPREAHGRAAQRDGAAPRQPAGGALRSTTRCWRAAARRSTTPRASSTCRSARAKSSPSRCSSGRPTARTASACDRRATSTSAPSPRAGTAAATRTPRAARSPATTTHAEGATVDRRRVDARSARVDRATAEPRPHGRRPAHRQALRPDVARRRRAPAPHVRRAQHRPHRHARSARDRAAAARPRPRDAAGVASDRRRQDLRRDDPSRLRHRHRRRGRTRRSASRRRRCPTTRRSTRRSRRFAARSSSCRPRTRPRRSAARRRTSWRGATSRSTLEAGDRDGARARPHRARRATACTLRRHRVGRLLRAGARARPRRPARAAARTWPRCGGPRSGPFDVADALPLADAERLGRDVAARLLSPAEALPDLPAVRLTEAGLRRALHGNPLGPEHLAGRWVPPATSPGCRCRLLAPDGRLVALAHSRGGALHPVVVLG